MKQIIEIFKNISGVIFDCDGVLLNSKAANMAYYNGILAYFGLGPLTPEEEEYSFMATVDQAFERYLPEQFHPRLDEAKKKLDYVNKIMPLIKLEEGMLDFVCLLRESGILCGIQTNRSTGMRIVLDTFDLHPYFNPVLTAAVVPPKPDPHGVSHILKEWKLGPQQVVFIGDSLVDAQTAQNSGVKFVAFGNEKLKPEAHVGGFAELSAAFIASRTK